MDINNITAGGIGLRDLATVKPDADKRPDEPAFGEWLSRSIRSVQQMQQEADLAARKLISGENKDIHGTMISMQKAGIAMDLMLEVRNKIIAAYDEIKRMQF